MSEMIDRVADALEAAFVEVGIYNSDYGSKGTLARVAIEAMREPTDKMRDAGAIHQAAGKSAVTDAIGTWQAMIDEATR